MDYTISEASCSNLVREFIRTLASRVKHDIESGKTRLTLVDVVKLASEFIEKHGSCNTPLGSAYLVFLFGQLDSLNKIVFDKSIEAMSAHLENVAEEIYSILSLMLTRYALHEINLINNVAAILRSGMSLDDERVVRLLSIVEPLIFATIARYLAVVYLVSVTPSERLSRMTVHLERAVSGYMTEEERAFTAIKFYVNMVVEQVEPASGGSDAGEASEDNRGYPAETRSCRLLCDSAPPGRRTR